MTICDGEKLVVEIISNENVSENGVQLDYDNHNSCRLYLGKHRLMGSALPFCDRNTRRNFRFGFTAFLWNWKGVLQLSYADVLPDGHVDILPDGHADVLTNGHANVLTDGHADVRMDGRTDVSTEWTYKRTMKSHRQ